MRSLRLNWWSESIKRMKISDFLIQFLQINSIQFLGKENAMFTHIFGNGETRSVFGSFLPVHKKRLYGGKRE